jgi:cytochrome oxidase Cu insertion factor (SCO1/SenC/PrrC family)
MATRDRACLPPLPSATARLWRAFGVVGLLGACTSLEGSGGNVLRPEQARVSLFDERWAWTDEEGSPVTFSHWRGTPLVLAAVYTWCRSTCPYTIEKMRRVEKAFQQRGEPAQFLLVTLDPAEDTPARLRDFKASTKLPQSWHLLRGNQDDTRDLTDLMDIHVFDAASHLVHDSKILVFNASGVAARSFACCNFKDYDAVL